MTSDETGGALMATTVREEVRVAVQKERLRIAKEMRAEAHDLAPKGKGDPNDCAMADLLLAWASGLDRPRP